MLLPPPLHGYLVIFICEGITAFWRLGKVKTEPPEKDSISKNRLWCGCNFEKSLSANRNTGFSTTFLGGDENGHD